MVVHDYNWILGSDAALDCVAKCLTIIYGEDDFKLPPKRTPAHYDALWKWWTRLRPVDVEPKLAALVAACHAEPWLSEQVEQVQVFVAPSYSVLGLLLLASGARAPQDLAHALVSAASRDCRRVLDLGAPSTSFAHHHRRELAKRLFAHDFSRSDKREFVREPFGPREVTLCAKVAEGEFVVGNGDEHVAPWFPSRRDVAPRLAVSGLEDDACAPWCDAPTLFLLARNWSRRPPQVIMYAPPCKPPLGAIPSLDNLEVLDFAPTEAEEEPAISPEVPDALAEHSCDPVLHAATGGRASAVVPPSLTEAEHACDVCGAGNCKRRCGRCRGAYYCSEECQRSAWPSHRASCAAPEVPPSTNDDDDAALVAAFAASQARPRPDQADETDDGITLKAPKPLSAKTKIPPAGGRPRRGARQGLRGGRVDGRAVGGDCDADQAPVINYLIFFAFRSALSPLRYMALLWRAWASLKTRSMMTMRTHKDVGGIVA